MSLVIGLPDIKPEYVNRQGKTEAGYPGAYSTSFLRTTPDRPDEPMASLNRYKGACHSVAHFHQVDQFQVIMEGKGTLGRHDVSPYCIHFSRAYTPYGPLQSEKNGWGFLVLRTRYDPGAQRFPGSYEKLKQTPNRRPWQTTARATFSERRSDVNVLEIPEIKDDQGLFAFTLTMNPHARYTAPDPAVGDGQYLIIVKGDLMSSDRHYEAPTVIFIKPYEGAFQLQAGDRGLDALVLNFPKVTPRAAEVRTSGVARAGLKKWKCELCSFFYDEAAGMPDEGVAPGTRWEDIPDTWTCPDCAATKSDFRMVEL